MTAAQAVPAAQVVALRRELGADRPSAKTVLWWLYLAVIIVFLVGGTLWESLRSALDQLGPDVLVQAGPVCLGAALLVTARFGLWQGPVIFSAADCSLLLTAPVARGDLVAPRLRMGIVTGAVAGFAAGVLVAGGGLVAHRLDALSVVATLAAAALLGVLAAAISWLVESSAPVGRRVARLSPVALLALGGLLAAGIAGGAERDVALWSGPWGWPLLGIAHGDAAALAGAALALALAVPAAVLAWRRTGACSLERFVARSATASSIVASLGTYDMRTAGVVRRGALRGATERSSGTAPRLPARRLRRDTFAPARRDLLYLRSSPGRVLLAAALAGGAGAACATGAVAWAAAGGVAAYVAAGVLLEPARTEIDVPGRVTLLLPWRLGHLLWLHAIVPAAFVALCAIAGAGVAALTGAGAPAAPLAALVIAVPLALLVTLAAAIVVRRGGRVPLTVILTAMSDPTGGISVVTWLLAGPMGVAAAGAILLAGPDAAADSRGAAALVVASAIGAGCIAFALQRVLVRPHADEG